LPFGWKVGETSELIAVPGQQVALRRMRKLKDQDLAQRTITDAMTAAGMRISHVAV
jgi:hypothetical protein